MVADKTTKVLLALILVALCALLLRLEVAPALAQSPQSSSEGVAIAHLGPDGTMAYVVSGGKISFWETDMVNGKLKLVMYDVQPLPK